MNRPRCRCGAFFLAEGGETVCPECSAHYVDDPNDFDDDVLDDFPQEEAKPWDERKTRPPIGRNG